MQEERLFMPGIPYKSRDLRRQLFRIGIAGAIYTVGIIGLLWNTSFIVRAALGALVVLAALRYPYLLLMTWVLIDVFIGTRIPFFNGHNFDSGLTVATFLVIATMPLRESLGRMPALTFLGLFLLWVLAGIGISPLETGTFLTRWLISLDFLAVSVLVINLLTTKRRLHGMIDAILLVTAFISAYAIYGYFTRQNGEVDPKTLLFRSASIFSPVAPSLAFFLCIIIPLAIYRLLTSHRLQRLIYVLLSLISLAALALTFTRAVVFSLPLSIIACIPLLPSRKLRAYLLSSTFVLAALLLVLVVGAGVPIFDRFTNGDITTLNGRTYLWQAVFNHFDPAQLLGNGLGASDILLTNLRIGFGGGVIDTSPHNFLLAALYEQGIIGLVLLLLTFVALAISLVRRIPKASGEYRILLSMAVVVWLNVVILSMDSNEVWSQSSGLYFWVVMALPFASCWSTTQHVSRTNQEPSHEEAAVRHAGG